MSRVVNSSEFVGQPILAAAAFPGGWTCWKAGPRARLPAPQRPELSYGLMIQDTSCGILPLRAAACITPPCQGGDFGRNSQSGLTPPGYIVVTALSCVPYGTNSTLFRRGSSPRWSSNPDRPGTQTAVRLREIYRLRRRAPACGSAIGWRPDRREPPTWKPFENSSWTAHRSMWMSLREVGA